MLYLLYIRGFVKPSFDLLRNFELCYFDLFTEYPMKLSLSSLVTCTQFSAILN